VEVSFPERRPSSIPLWVRICVGCIAVSAAVVDASKHFANFGWITPLSLGCFFFFFTQRQPGEPLRRYLLNPRALLTLLFALTAAVTSLWFLIRGIP
jgi:hypothetical protein